MSEGVRLHSFFTSIQGESTRAGLPCTFLRLAGCPLACSFCDTPDARAFAGEEVGVAGLVRRCGREAPRLVEVTGGEPLAQDGTPALLSALADAGFEVLLETSGAFPVGGIDRRVRVVMDIKTPGSGMSDRMCGENLAVLERGRHEVKLVVDSRADFDWAVARVRAARLDERCDVLVSPVAGRVALPDLAGWILGCGLPLRLQPQLHRIIWPDAGRTEER